MDFSEYDRIDDFELNEILWRAVKGGRPAAPGRPTGHRIPSVPGSSVITNQSRGTILDRPSPPALYRRRFTSLSASRRVSSSDSPGLERGS